MSDPTTVTGDQVHAALTALGIPGPVEDIVRLEIDYRCVTMTRFRFDETGRLFPAGDEAAKTVTTIGIDWSDE